MGLALGGAGLSVLLVRLGWGGRRWVASAGWALATASLLTLALTDGAWGLAMGTTIGAIVAMALVLQAGWVSPRGRARKDRETPSVDVPHSWRGTGRRLAVFALVVPVSFAASLWLAYGINAVMKGGAPLEANSVATLLLVQPLAWTVLMTWQMLQPGPRRMIAQPLVAAMVGTLLWVLA